MAQDGSDHVRCDLKIYGNEVPCKFFGFVIGCPLSELEESKYSFTTEIHEGESKSGLIGLKKVIIDPMGPNEKDYKIVLFADDKREESLKLTKKIDLISFELETKVKFDAKRENLGTFIDFEFLNTIDDIGIKLNCYSISKSINQDNLNDKRNSLKFENKSNSKSVSPK